MSAGFIYFFHTAPAAQTMRLQAALLRHGLGLRLYENVDALCASLANPEASGEPRLVMLADADALNCQAAQALRRVAPLVGIVALQACTETDAMLEAMRSGVDTCWPQDAPLQLVAAGVLRLMSRIETRSGRQTAAVPTAQSPWRLTSGGWMVQTPEGSCITLTTAERALVLALCRAPGRRLGHAELMRSVDGGFRDTGQSPLGRGKVSYARRDARRLSVLVSRLRHKFAVAGIEMPIRSLRRQGYEINVEFSWPTDNRAARVRGEEQDSLTGSLASAPGAGPHAVAVEPVVAVSAAAP